MGEFHLFVVTTRLAVINNPKNYFYNFALLNWYEYRVYVYGLDLKCSCQNLILCITMAFMGRLGGFFYRRFPYKFITNF